MTRPSERLDIATSQWAKERPDVDSRLFQLVSAITMIAQKIEIEFRQLALRIGGDLGPGDLRILFILRRSGEPYAQRPVDLVRHLLVTSGAITKQIARLEAKGLVSRSRSPGKRGWLIQLTDAGKAIADRAMDHDAFPLVTEAFESFDAKEQAEGVRFARRLLGRLERTRINSERDA